MWNLSAGHMYRAVIRATVPDRPEYITVAAREIDRIETLVAVANWNLLWEAAQFRRRFFDPTRP
jgi:hypothetical protein